MLLVAKSTAISSTVSLLEPTQVKWAATLKLVDWLSAFTASNVSLRVVSPAPHVTETKGGWRSAKESIVSEKRKAFLILRGGKT